MDVPDKSDKLILGSRMIDLESTGGTALLMILMFGGETTRNFENPFILCELHV